MSSTISSKVNDFVVRFANVNGTGSASANFLFTKSIFRMGIPVTPKNIFPSNIQGLPTWYEVRISEKGYLGRRDGIDLMVAMNPQSMANDVASVKSGGYFLYDSTKMLHEQYIRDDINYIGIPLMEMCNREYTDPRQRQLFKNIIYVGALSALFNIEFAVLEKLIAEQFPGKEKLIPPNIKALQMGVDYVKANFKYPLEIHVARRDLVKDAIMIDGNSACGLGAVYAGATVAAWYPITPSTSVVEAFSEYASEYRTDKETGKRNVAIVQAEDELAAIGMVIGANWNGARSFTATSGPGVSLMNEFLGLAYFAEIPTVLIDVQRTGPSTGMPTRTQQSDVMEAAYASHGDTKHVLLLPRDANECFEFGAASLDLADRLQTPIFLLTDLDIGMNERLVAPFAWDDSRKLDRGKVMTAEELEAGRDFGRYTDVDGDGIPYRTYPGTHPTRGSFFTRGTSRDRRAIYTEDGAAYQDNMERLLRKFETAKSYVPAPVQKNAATSTKLGAIYYGSTSDSMEEAADLLAAEGVEIDLLRVRAFPFNNTVDAFIEQHEQVFVVEQNRDAQLRTLLINEGDLNPRQLVRILHYDGTPITARQIAGQIRASLGLDKAAQKEAAE